MARSLRRVPILRVVTGFYELNSCVENEYRLILTKWPELVQ